MRIFFRRMMRGFSVIYLYIVIIFSYQLLVVEATPVNANDRRVIYPCGQIAGLYIQSDGVFVIDTCQIESSSGELINPAEDLLEAGDYIIAVNGESIYEKETLVEQVTRSNGQAITLTIERDEELLEVDVTPVLGKDGKYKLGVWVKDDLAGVGTITYVTDTGVFGALGHGMNNGETRNLMEINGGDVYLSAIISIEKGEVGNPGQVKGVLYYGEQNHLGEIDSNVSTGIYGKIDEDNLNAYTLEQASYEIAYKKEVKTGKAQILSDISGEERYYDIEITYVDYLAMDENKGLHIKVTDPELLELTGGIIQGMSGSPIIQNGRIVGAVTHVLINYPEKGFGIFIEEMLK